MIGVCVLWQWPLLLVPSWEGFLCPYEYHVIFDFFDVELAEKVIMLRHSQCVAFTLLFIIQLIRKASAGFEQDYGIDESHKYDGKFVHVTRKISRWRHAIFKGCHIQLMLMITHPHRFFHLDHILATDFAYDVKSNNLPSSTRSTAITNLFLSFLQSSGDAEVHSTWPVATAVSDMVAVHACMILSHGLSQFNVLYVTRYSTYAFLR